MIYESIYELHKNFNISVHRTTELLGISESAYYNWVRNGRILENNSIKLMHAIINEYAKSHGIYGAGKITSILNRKHFSVSQSTVSRYMCLMGIRSIVFKNFKPRRSRFKKDDYKDIINLIKGLKIDHLNQVWTTDISYIKTIEEGNLYFISFIDQYSKKVVAWDLKYSQTTKDVLDVLQVAIKNNKPSPGLIIHSDKGSQMRSFEYKIFLSKYKFICSYTSINHSCDENACQESFHSILKRERLYLRKLKNYVDSYGEIYDYIENFYNPKRIHTKAGNLSPVDFEKSLNKS